MHLAVEQDVFTLEISVDDAALVTILDGVTQLTEPDGRLTLGDALELTHGVEQVAARRLLHYDVHTSVRLDRLLVCETKKMKKRSERR